MEPPHGTRWRRAVRVGRRQAWGTFGAPPPLSGDACGAGDVWEEGELLRLIKANQENRVWFSDGSLRVPYQNMLKVEVVAGAAVGGRAHACVVAGGRLGVGCVCVVFVLDGRAAAGRQRSPRPTPRGPVPPPPKKTKQINQVRPELQVMDPGDA